jgi:hypothetical protein
MGVKKMHEVKGPERRSPLIRLVIVMPYSGKEFLSNLALRWFFDILSSLRPARGFFKSIREKRSHNIDIMRYRQGAEVNEEPNV